MRNQANVSMEGLEKKREKKVHGKRPPKFDHRKKFGAREKYSSTIENEIRKLNAQYEEVSMCIEQ